ncbi:ABC transporter permease [Lachnoclostridium sp. An131]|uniref:ABC transporter permease n=1 Tax=Lachnoclostridium sp. An131 TaxID=1965555 RepID=UPI001FA86947|nr:ABC transporter permease [Lachnoclostridium sp. An131]
MAWVSRDFADEMIAEEKSFAGADADTQTPDSASDGNVLGTFMAQVSLYSDQNIEADLNDILADTGLSDLEYSVNLAYSPEMGATAFQESLPLYLGMILVFIAGFLIIYNIFQISVTADIQFYGRLKTLGTTNRQIRRLIFGQAGRICLIGIPLGLLFGWLLGMVLVPSFLGILEGESTVSANPVIFIGSALFAWITVLLSCLRPARLAGKVSPIEALRMNDAASKSRKSRKRRRGSASLSSMAWSNLGRNKRRTVTVICSLTLALVLLCSFYAQNASFDIEKYLADLTLADFELTDSDSGDSLNGYDPASTSLSSSLVRDLENQEGLEASGHLYTGQADWQIDDDTLKNLQNFYTEDALAGWETYDAAGAGELRAALKSREASARVYGLDGIPLDAITQEPYILQGSFDAEAFASGDYVLAVGPAIDLEQVHSFLDDYRETTDSSLPVTSRQTMAEQYEAETRSSSVMGNAVSVVIALVGILNFINSMVTAIVSRRREFAMIQSVGMTKKQLCRMLVYEGLFYAVITLAASFIVSALSVGILIRAMVSGGFSTFHFTLLPLGVCAPLLLLFAVLIPCLCFRNLEKQSIVVRLRME